jgi:hypothetical protein
MLLFFLLGADVFVNYRLRVGSVGAWQLKPMRKVQEA